MSKTYTHAELTNAIRKEVEAMDLGDIITYVEEAELEWYKTKATHSDIIWLIDTWGNANE
jgi:hypothetical protein